LIDLLEQNGYHEAMKELDDKRDAMHLTLDKEPVAGESLVLSFSGNGKVSLPGTLEKPASCVPDEHNDITIEKLPELLQRDQTHFPVVQTDKQGYSRIRAKIPWVGKISIRTVRRDGLP
jgi:hypothetical protein